MAYDILIKNGTLIDGRGNPGQFADVAIEGERIVAVGTVDGTATRVIDAEGRLVTPGFIDIHTHLDAQFGWDPLGTSSCHHGVTSTIMGNCGVSFAPCKAADRETLAELMESVEDIPRDTIMNGLPWDWTSYGEYLDSLARLRLGLNLGGMVGHCAIRVAAMGERSLDETPASLEDVEKICQLVDESIEGGALGFSTSRTLMHVVPDGRPVPGTFADENELLAIAGVMARKGRGVLEGALKLGERDNEALDASRKELQLMAEISRRSGRPFTFGSTQSTRRPNLHNVVLEECTKANETGAQMRPQSTCRSINFMVGISALTPFLGRGQRPASWKGWSRMSVEERLAHLDDAKHREQMIADAEAVAEEFDFDSLYLLPIESARYDNDPNVSVTALASKQNTTPQRLLIEMIHASRGEQAFYQPFLNQDQDTVGEFIRNPMVAMGLGDSGAHVGQIMDAGQATWLLKHWVRERNWIPVEQAIHLLTGDPAGIFGLSGRGVVAPGAYADVNVIDLEHVDFPAPRYVEDFPGGAARWVQGAVGYDYTLVNGSVLMDHGEHTGELRGKLLRGSES